MTEDPLQLPFGHWILDGKTPVPEPDLLRWAEWFGTADRIVARDQIGDIRISTVFLGLDHNWGDGPPLLFETMTFRNEKSTGQWRCSTWAQAEKQHRAAVEETRTKWMTQIIETTQKQS